MLPFDTLEFLIAELGKKVPFPLILLDREHKVVCGNSHAHENGIDIGMKCSELFQAQYQCESGCKADIENRLVEHPPYRISAKSDTEVCFFCYPISPQIFNEKGYIIIMRSTGKSIPQEIEKRKLMIQRQDFLERFSAHTFHKIANRFMVLMTDVDLLRRKISKRDEQNINKLAKNLEDDILSLSDMIQALSFFTKSPGKHSKKCDLLKILDSSISELKQRASFVKIEYCRPKRKIFIGGYRILLSKIFNGVLDNALKAVGDNGKIKIKVETLIIDSALAHRFPELSMGNYIIISISDNGIGMPNEIIDRIFEPFFSGWEKPSSGLGLSIALSAARQHDGSIDIRSAEKKGTDVNILLPLKIVLSRKEMDSYPHGNNETILIIDDIEAIKRSISLALEEMGYKPIVAADGKTGIRLFKKREPDLVLLDMILPDMHGNKVLDELLKINPAIPVIIITAFSQVKEIETAIEKGIVNVIQKPFDSSRLAVVLHNIFSKK